MVVPRPSSTNASAGLSAQDAIAYYADELTLFEKSEMSRYSMIYYIGSIRVRNL